MDGSGLASNELPTHYRQREGIAPLEYLPLNWIENKYGIHLKQEGSQKVLVVLNSFWVGSLKVCDLPR